MFRSYSIAELKNKVAEKQTNPNLDADDVTEEFKSLSELFWRDGSVEEYEELAKVYIDYINQRDDLKSDEAVKKMIDDANEGITKRKKFIQEICVKIQSQLSTLMFQLQQCDAVRQQLSQDTNYTNASQALEFSYNAITTSYLEKIAMKNFNQFVENFNHFIETIILNLQKISNEKTNLENRDKVASSLKSLLGDAKKQRIIFNLERYRTYAYQQSLAFIDVENPLNVEIDHLLTRLNKFILSFNNLLQNDTSLTYKQQNKALITHIPAKPQKTSSWSLTTFIPKRESAYEKNKRIFLNNNSKAEERAKASLKLAIHFKNIANSNVTPSIDKTVKSTSDAIVPSNQEYIAEYEARNHFIQAGVYLESYLALSDQMKELVKYFEDIRLNQQDISGAHWYVEFHNMDIPLYTYPKLAQHIGKDFTVEDLLAMRNTAIDLSLLVDHINQNLLLKEDQYLLLASRYPHFVAEQIFLNLIREKPILPAYALNKLPNVSEKLLARLRASAYGGGVTRDTRAELSRLLDSVRDQIKIKPETINEFVDNKIKQEVDWMFWSSYNRNKFKYVPKEEISQQVNAYITKYNENPLNIFNFNKNEIPDITTDVIRKKYRQLVLIYHPDKRTGPDPKLDEGWRKLQDAYSLLSDAAILASAKKAYAGLKEDKKEDKKEETKPSKNSHVKESIFGKHQEKSQPININVDNNRLVEDREYRNEIKKLCVKDKEFLVAVCHSLVSEQMEINENFENEFVLLLQTVDNLKRDNSSDSHQFLLSLLNDMVNFKSRSSGDVKEKDILKEMISAYRNVTPTSKP